MIIDKLRRPGTPTEFFAYVSQTEAIRLIRTLADMLDGNTGSKQINVKMSGSNSYVKVALVILPESDYNDVLNNRTSFARPHQL